MEAPENTSPRYLPANVDYKATLWAANSLPIASGIARITDDLSPDCDGVFEILVEEHPLSSESRGIAVSVGDFQIAAIQPVDGSVRDRHGRIPFLWADI